MATMATIGGITAASVATMGAIGVSQSMDAGPTPPDPWEIYRWKRAGLYMGVGGVAGGGAGMLAGRKHLGKRAGWGALAGAAIGIIGGAIFAKSTTNAEKRGAYMGGRVGQNEAMTRVSGSVGQIAQLRADIARLHKPIRGGGY